MQVYRLLQNETQQCLGWVWKKLVEPHSGRLCFSKCVGIKCAEGKKAWVPLSVVLGKGLRRPSAGLAWVLFPSCLRAVCVFSYRPSYRIPPTQREILRSHFSPISTKGITFSPLHSNKHPVSALRAPPVVTHFPQNTKVGATHSHTV